MNNENTKERDAKTAWVKEDGKTEIRLNNYPATIKKAEELGFKKKK